MRARMMMTMTMRRRAAMTLIERAAAALVLVAMAAAGAAAQDLGMKAAAQEGTVALSGATVHTVSGGTIARGTVVFREGVITWVGPGEAPAGEGVEVTVDASGLHVYPGLVGANTQLGLMEIGAVRATLDVRETGSVTPEVRAVASLNPDSTLIPVTRSNGVLTAGVLPMGGLVPGRAAVIRLDGWTWEDLSIEADAGLVVNWPNMRVQRGWWVTRSEAEQREEIGERVERLYGVFEDAAAYFAAREADGEGVAVDLRYEAMRGAMEGGERVFVRANQVEQIRGALAWAERFGLGIVIVGGMDADLAAEDLARADVGVILTGTHRMPGRRDAAYDRAFTLPMVLEEAGIAWCMATTGGTFQTPHERNLPYHAATAVAYGLARETALRSVTLSAAELLGVGDRLGSIEAGKAATLIVTDGDPLELTTGVRMAFIDGREIELGNKQTVLDEKYREKYRRLGLIEE